MTSNSVDRNSPAATERPLMAERRFPILCSVYDISVSPCRPWVHSSLRCVGTSHAFETPLWCVRPTTCCSNHVWCQHDT